MAEKRATTIRLPNELRPRLDAFARDTRRSRNGAVVWLITYALDRIDKQTRKAAA